MWPLYRGRALAALSRACYLCFVWIAWAELANSTPPESTLPEVRDSRLRLSLFASEPDIVTPIGATVDAGDRLFVIESHTHLPEHDYDGPDSDRIKVFEDADGDGKPERISVFADGFDDAMNLAFSPQGDLYVVHRAGVSRLSDENDDGISDTRREIIWLETSQTYAHSCLLGVLVSHDGWLYVSRGNTGGHAYTLHTRAGEFLSGYGDGGHIVRCRLDGSELREVATGFWNPFALEIDAFGRLLCADNDPDARGPNRLVHIMRGGNYGFRSLYGGSGLHPYCAWNGELPDTLPLLAGTGEAPSGVLACDYAALPEDYAGDYLVTTWGAHAIERYRPKKSGTSFQGEREVVIQGGADFRPVGITADSRGTVYFTDWVKKDYPNHGQGRIWRLTCRDQHQPHHRRNKDPQPCEEEAQLNALLSCLGDASQGTLADAVRSHDPFRLSAAVTALSHSENEKIRQHWESSNEAALRLAALLGARRSGRPEPEAWRRYLSDPDPRIRMMAVMWAGETQSTKLHGELPRALEISPVTQDLVSVYLATQALLSEEFLRTYEAQIPGFRRPLPSADIAALQILRDASLPVTARRNALAMLEEINSPAAREALELCFQDSHLDLRRAVVWTWALQSPALAEEKLFAVALDATLPRALRADALAGLARQPGYSLEAARELWQEGVPLLRRGVARWLAPHAGQPEVRSALSEFLHESAGETQDHAEVMELLRFALRDPQISDSETEKTESDPQWLASLAEPGDVDEGRRVFFHPGPNCARCHRVQARGGRIGPNLSVIGSSLDRARLIRSITHPSEEIAQEFMAHTVVTLDGEVLTGLQFHFRSGNHISLMPIDGGEIRLSLDDVETYQTLDTSLMPEGLHHQMTTSDMRHLLAFLLSLK